MTDYNQLAPHHFRQEPKPERKDFVYHLGTDDWDEDDFQKALKEHDKKYQEPKYNWVRFNAKPPKEGQYVYTVAKKETDPPFVLKYTKGYKLSIWCDKEIHDQKLAYYNYHKVLFEGWELYDSDWVRKGHYQILFSKTGLLFETLQGSIIYQGKCSISLFKSICQENEIEI